MNRLVIGPVPAPELRLGACVVLPDRAEARFDSRTETWTVTATDGTRGSAAVVVDTRPSPNPTVADHGIPNYFRIPGPGVARQARYVARCLRLLEHSGAARIEARRRLTGPGRLPRSLAGQFFLTGAAPGPDEGYDGPVTVTFGGNSIAGRARLAGHLDPIDGRYHWQGTVFGTLPDGARGRAAALTLTVGERSATARVVETTPWGTAMVAGVGAPPFDC